MNDSRVTNVTDEPVGPQVSAVSGSLPHLSGKGETVQKWIKAIDDWTESLKSGGVTQQTIRTRRYQLGRLAEDRLHRSPWKLTSSDLAGWIAKHDWTPATIRTYRSALRSFYRWGVEEGHIKTSPADKLRKVTVPRRRPRPTPTETIQEAMTQASDLVRMVILLGSHAGLRRAEIAALRWDHINGGVIWVRGKWDQDRYIPVHEVLAAELTAERSRRAAGELGTGYRHNVGLDHDDGWIFPGRLSGHMSPEHLGRLVHEGLGGTWTTHSLRHHFGCRVLDATGNLAAVQELMGHASPETTRIYTNVTGGTLTAAIDAI